MQKAKSKALRIFHGLLIKGAVVISAMILILLPSLSIAYTPDIKAYCEAVSARRIGEDYNDNALNIFSNIKTYSEDFPYFSYRMSKSPNIENQKLGLMHAKKVYDFWVLKNAKANPNLEDVFSNSKYLSNYTISKKAQDEANDLFNTFVQLYRSTQNMALVAAGTSTCGYSLECLSALKKVYDIMSAMRVAGSSLTPKRFGDLAFFSAPKVLRNLFLDPRFKVSTQKLLSRMLANQTSGNFLTDIQEVVNESFRKPQDQQEALWTYLGFYGTRGGSVAILFPYFHEDYAPLIGQLHMIHTLANYFDVQMAPKGLSYVLPKTVSTTCFHGGHYHFWMSAYLTRELKAQGFSDSAAINAVTKSGVNYEYFMFITSKPFTTHPQTNWFNNFSTFQDLASNQFGAMYSLNPDRPLDFDSIIGKGIQYLPPIKMDQPSNKISGAIQSNYFTWKKAVGLDLLESSLEQ